MTKRTKRLKATTEPNQAAFELILAAMAGYIQNTTAAMVKMQDRLIRLDDSVRNEVRVQESHRKDTQQLLNLVHAELVNLHKDDDESPREINSGKCEIKWLRD